MSEKDLTEDEKHNNEEIHGKIPVSGMYKNWFLDYASYVILERAVPAAYDGLKPVQRRILHSMKDMDDGRYNKVANIIGHTMQYHPHGDASIGDAITNIGQKDLLIDTQGNWGDIRTGDGAAAPRYIEARLSKFALEVVFNPQTTEWQLSYDGRKKEPIILPVKFPLLLAQGVEGIAVGLSTKVLPHNFIELIDASISYLKNKKVDIYPDFPTGGQADFSDYNEGLRGGKVRIRAKIESGEKNTLIVKEIPFSTTTTGIIDSIIKANDKGKIKIKKVVDNTAKDVEIQITLASGQSPDITIDALYAFTDCEVSISPNSCVILEDKPVFMSVNKILKLCTDSTLDLLKRELEIKKASLLEKILFSSLEKIFIENRIYRDIEECETWESVLETIDKGLDPFKKQFYRKIITDDIVKLTEIKIKRISRFDAFKADELMKRLEEELKEVNHHLENLVTFAIDYFKNLKDKYGAGRERKTEIQKFDTITATVVAANNQKLYVNRSEGFAGYGLKKEEFISECSDLDDIIAIRKDGKFKVSRITDKIFMGKDILHVGVWKKGDERMVYNLIYVDSKSGKSMVKRFNITAITRDKEYDLTKGGDKSKVHYLSANPNGEAEVVTIKLTAGCTARKKIFDFDFSELEIKGRGAGGNTLTRYPVRRVDFKSEGQSTLSGLDLWYDPAVGRLNKEKRGEYIGNFDAEDRIVVFYNDGSYELTNYELTNRYETDRVLHLTKLEEKLVASVIYLEGDSKTYYVKRFQVETTTLDKNFNFISESKGSKLEIFSIAVNPEVEVNHLKGKTKDKVTEKVNLKDFIDIKGWKAVGNKLPFNTIKKITLLGEETVKSKAKPVKMEALVNQNTKTEKSEKSKELSTEKKVSKTKSNSRGEMPAKKENTSTVDKGFDVGETIEFEVEKPDQDKKDQLGLF